MSKMLAGLKAYVSEIPEEAGRFPRPRTPEEEIEKKKTDLRGLLSDTFKKLHSPEMKKELSPEVKLRFFEAMEALLKELSRSAQASFIASGGEGPCPFLSESGFPEDFILKVAESCSKK